MKFRRDLVGRNSLLREINSILSSKKSGRCHIFLSGPSASGKSSVLRALSGERDGLLCLTVRMSHTVATPELFAANYVEQLSLQLKKMIDDPDGESSVPSSAIVPLLALSERLLEKDISIRSVIEQIFELPERLSQTTGRRVVMIYDDFEHILELTTYRELKGLFSMFTAILKSHKNVSYIISGNRSLINSRIIEKNIFYRDRFSTIEVGPLSRKDSYLLTSVIIGRDGRHVPRELLMAVYRFSLGYPPYIRALCERAHAISSEEGCQLSSVIVARAFVDEVLSCSGQIYRECHARYFGGLSVVKGANSLKAVLQVLSAEEGLTLTEIGRKINRSRGQVYGYVKSLVSADLLIEKHKTYYFSDPLLRFFLAYSTSFFHERSLDTREALRWSGVFIRDYLCNRPWLPFALYDAVESIALKFEGQLVKGKEFSSRRNVRLPLSRSVEPLIGVWETEEEGTNLVVSDIWIRGHRRHWMVEVHRGEELFSVEDYEAIKARRTFFERSTKRVFDSLWIVSQSGFSEEAAVRMAADRVLFTRAEGSELVLNLESVEELESAA